jgi:ubiquinone/menaquinone biosynthesis C-methylase UbiE
MSWFDLPRVPEPEAMDDSGQVEAYSSAAAETFLNHIDDTLVDHAARLVAGRATGRALDIGTGPGQIVLKLARRLPDWELAGVDRAANMIAQARESLAEQSAKSGVATRANTLPVPRIQFMVGDGNRLPFPDHSFDLVMCNSVLHHLAEPQKLFTEIARLAKPDGAILIRDLRRPSRFAFPLHVGWHGRHYSGLMYRLYCDSVRSAYTVGELESMLRRSALEGAGHERNRPARVFTHQGTHIGIERAAQ